MTYKKIVAMMVEEDARKWLEKVLAEHGYESRYVFVEDGGATFESDKDMDTFRWAVKLTVRFKKDPGNYYFEIGGTVDDFCGIFHSVIWNRKHDILWMSVKQTREQLGIKEFKIA